MVTAVKMKRFWDKVKLAQVENGYEFYLDEHLLRLPGKTVLRVKELPLARKIVEEWEKAGHGKGDVFTYDSLPMTRIIGTMIEKVAPDRQLYIQTLLPYVNGDLLCYRAEKPQELVEEQKRQWDPVLQWFEEKFSLSLTVGYGVMPLVQDKAILDRIEKHLSNLSDGALTAYAVLVPLLGSMVLTIALETGHISPQAAFELAYLDETVQQRIWGEDQEEKERLEKIKKEILEGAEFLSLIKNNA